MLNILWLCLPITITIKNIKNLKEHLDYTARLREWDKEMVDKVNHKAIMIKQNA